MAFQSPTNNTAKQISVILGCFAMICLATAAFFNFDAGKAIKMAVSTPGEHTQTFESKKKNQVYFVRLISSTRNLPVNSGWSQAEVEIVDDQANPLFAFGGDFWRARGRDSDGRWSESKDLNKMKITLREPGTYSLNIDYSSSVSNPGKLSLSLQPKRASSLPFFWLGIFSLIGAIIMGYFAQRFAS